MADDPTAHSMEIAGAAICEIDSAWIMPDNWDMAAGVIIARAIDQAVAEQREKDAAIAVQWGKDNVVIVKSTHDAGMSYAASEIANAIREGK